MIETIMLYEHIENEISEFFKTNEYSLCDIFILKSIFDVSAYSIKNSKGLWNGVVLLEDKFTVNLDFIASSIGHYYWRPSFLYHLITSSSSSIDCEIYKILKAYEEKDKQNRGMLPPKRTFLCHKSTKDYRSKIKNEIQKHYIIKKLDKHFSFFEIIDDNTIVVEKNILNEITQNKQSITKILDDVYGNYILKFNPLLPKITIKKLHRSYNLSDSIFNKIKAIQTHCFYCNDANFDIQEHVIPEQLVAKTLQSNIVASCKKCNAIKWDYLLSNKEFERVLQRNELHEDVLEDNYNSIEFKKIYDTWLAAGIPIWNP